MDVSVVVPTYTVERYEDFTACVDAIRAGNYDEVEIVIIVDGNDEVCERAQEDYGEEDDIVIFCSHDDAGPVSRANMGAVQASGELVVLTDDDALPEPDWLEQLVETYEKHDAIAVGGRIEPEWVAGEAEFIPEEFYFLIGATHRGFRETEGEVRNTFGANLGFDREAFLRLGGIRQSGIESHNVQGRETEFCTRLQREYGQGVMYNPDAVVKHKVYEYRTDGGWLLRRAFWQGYSKRAMAVLVPDSAGEESDFLSRLVFTYLPSRIANLVRQPSRTKASQLIWLVLLLGVTGLGYLYSVFKWR